MQQNKHLIVVSGATASGKTSLGIRLAQHFKTVVVSADSRQFYKEMSIGTAKPTPAERQAAPHYFVDSLSIEEPYSVGQYEREALGLLENLYAHHDVVIMVGGSGLFIKAVCDGLDDFPEVPAAVRTELEEVFERGGIEALQAELWQTDPHYAREVDLQNHARLLRALEVIRASGQPFSSFRTRRKADRFFKPLKLVLDWEREQLYERINRRVWQMVEEGLEEEARLLFPLRHHNALQTVGYQEWFAHFEGKIDRTEAIRQIQRNTRRYAKRQMTWWRKETDVLYLSPALAEGICEHIEQLIFGKMPLPNWRK